MAPSSYNKHRLGFTLIELMITVSIIGIIAAIAYPAYNQHVLKVNRSEGKSMLIQAIADQERYHVENNTYASNLGVQGLKYSSIQSKHGYYALSVDNETAACPIELCFKLTIDSLAGQLRDTDCVSFSQTNTGHKSATASDGTDSTEDCW